VSRWLGTCEPKSVSVAVSDEDDVDRDLGRQLVSDRARCCSMLSALQ
jgi:hypothetical protein